MITNDNRYGESRCHGMGRTHTTRKTAATSLVSFNYVREEWCPPDDEQTHQKGGDAAKGGEATELGGNLSSVASVICSDSYNLSSYTSKSAGWRVWICSALVYSVLTEASSLLPGKASPVGGVGL